MHPKAIRQIVLLSDLVAICFSAMAAYMFRAGGPWNAQHLQIAFHESLFLMTASGIAWMFVFHRLKLDGFYGGYQIASVLSQLLSGLLLLIVLVASAGFLVKDYISRLLLIYFVEIFFVLALAARLCARYFAAQLAGKGKRRRILILGQGKIAQEIAERVKQHPEMRWEIVGFLFPSSEDFAAPLPGGPGDEQFNTLQIESLLKREKIEEIVLASPGLEQGQMLNLIANCRQRGIHISVVPHLYQLYVTRPALVDLDGLPLLSLADNRPTLLQAALKRVSDLLLGLTAMVVMAPALVAVGLALRAKKGKALASEFRCGRDGRVFRMYRLNCDRTADDVSRFENLLRKLSFTELPQLINVLKGDMSLLGPRPETEDRVKRYSDWQRQRLVVKPGMAGLAQVHGLRESHSSEDKTYFDLRYIQDWSLLADFSLLLQTVWTVAGRFRTVPQQIPDLTPVLDPSPQPVELVHADRS